VEQFFLKNSKAGIQANHAKKLSRLLGRLNVSTKPEDMNLPGFWSQTMRQMRACRGGAMSPWADRRASRAI
jgi:proteic killer suppression protein